MIAYLILILKILIMKIVLFLILISCNNYNVQYSMIRSLLNLQFLGRCRDEFTNIRKVASEKIRLRVKRELRKRREERILGQSFSNKFSMYCG